MTERPDWDAYFLLIATVVATRSTCLRRRVGAVIVRDRRIVSTGYNGAPRTAPHCAETGCLRERLGIPSGERHEICRGAHAELNAVCQAAAGGMPTEGGTIYSTHEPCAYCTKAIASSGLVRVVFLHPYPDETARRLRAEAGIECTAFPPEALPRDILP